MRFIHASVQSNGNIDLCSKDEALNFKADIAKDNKYKTKFIRNTVVEPAPNQANWILKNAAIAVLLKYLHNFWWSLKMPLINCKIELKIKWKNYFVLSRKDNDNANDNDHGKNTVFDKKGSKLYVPVATLSARDNKKLSNIRNKAFKDPFIGINIKLKLSIKIRQMNIDAFSNQVLLELIDYLL